jgi:hypothetical protein
LLATLYGVPEPSDRKLRDKNRVAWNRYFAANLDEETRARLAEEKRHPAEELKPFSPKELRDVAEVFAKRSKGSVEPPALPASDAQIDFSGVQFDRFAVFNEYHFGRSSFVGMLCLRR